MTKPMIMSRIQYSKFSIRNNILILFVLTLTCAMQQPNTLHDTTQSMLPRTKMSAFNNYNGSSSTTTTTNNNNNMFNNNRFSSIRQILYRRPNQHPNETLRWHKINMITNLFRHRVKRKAIATPVPVPVSVRALTKPPSQSSDKIASKAIIYERNSSTNFLDFSYNTQQIRETILNFVHLNMLLNQRSIHNASDILAVNFSHNVITQIDASILKSLPHVRRLDLSYNHIEWFNVSVAGNQIEWLSISSNQLHTFDGKNLEHLKYLDLSCNHIEHTTHIQLNELGELEYINLAGNRLSCCFQPHQFEKLIKLKVISLSHNRFERINNNMFRNLVDIEALDLSYNRIALIGNASFLHSPKLQYLDLSYNAIDAASLNAFLGIPNLIKLSIAFNTQLSDALQGFFSSWSLKHLDMGGTGLCEIPNALTQSVRTLNISNNEFAVIRCGDLDSYPLLQSLDISSCHITDIEDDALGRLDMLNSLYLNNNGIARVPSSLPLNLVRLFLQNNRIAEIQSATFSHLVNLEVVNLSGNQLKYLPSLPLPRLMILDVRMSGVRRLSQSIIKISPNLRVVYLDGNPIKCNELLGVAEWATPCRTDDFIELETLDGDNKNNSNSNRNKDADERINTNIWQHCKCKACQLDHSPFNLGKTLHCVSKNETDIKPQTNGSGSKTEDSHLNSTWLLNSNDKNKSSLNDIAKGLYAHVMRSRPVNNQTIMVHQQLKRSNNSNLHDNMDAAVIRINENNQIEQVKPTDKFNVPQIMADSSSSSSSNITDTIQSPQSETIITNDIQNGNANANINISDAKSSSLETVAKNSNSNTTAGSVKTNTKGGTIGTSTTLPHVTVVKAINLTKSTTESITDKENKISTHIDMLVNKETLNLSQTRILSSGIVNRHRIHKIDEARNVPILINTLESSTATETATSPTISTIIKTTTSTLQISVINSSDNRMNVEQNRDQPPQNVDEYHKENKSKVNWNINKAISTTNDNIQRDRNLVISTFHAGGDNALDTVHINEINKNQPADENQLNKNHTPNVTVSREKSVEESQPPQQQQPKCSLMKKCLAKENENANDGLNKRIINSNTFTEIGMVINDENKNGQPMNGIDDNSVSFRRKIAIKTEQMSVDSASSIDMNKESANIGSTKMSTISSHLSDQNQRPNIDTNTMVNRNGNNNNNNNTLMAKKKNSTVEIDAEKSKVDDNDSNRPKMKNKQIKQIKNTVKFTTETSKKENPLIGHVSLNVSIIDNEHQFERPINNNHSMHEQITLERYANTKLLQSANEHVKPYIQDQYDNSNDNGDVVVVVDGGGGGNSNTNTNRNSNSHRSNDGLDIIDASDNSAIHGVSEQWNDKRVTSGHSGLFVVIGIGIGVFVTLNLVHLYRYKKRNNNQRNAAASMEPNRHTENLLVGMQMEMLNTLHYTDTPIDLW